MSLSFSLDEFKIIYLVVTLGAWLVMGLFAPRYLSHHKPKGRFAIFSILTLVGTAGVFVSDDLFTLFLFFEVMSMASYVWVAEEESKGALKAADTYMAVAVIGGLVLLMGLFLLYNAIGTLKISELRPAVEMCGASQGRIYAAAMCMLFGFGAKAGAFPLHIWLPKAHPVAPAPASALLSGILTKTGVYGIILTGFCVVRTEFFGWLIIGIALVTMVTGAVLALFSTDLKRTLACSSVSQIGFILTGVGVATILKGNGSVAMSGSLLHMLNHSLIKLDLFLCAGVVYQNLHELDLDKIRGYGRKKPFLFAMFLIGALGIGGVPGFNGYISKSLLHEAIGGCEAYSGVFTFITEWTFVISGGFTVAYMLKLFICLFIEKNSDLSLQAEYDLKKSYMSPAQKIAILVPTVIIPVIGIFVGPVSLRITDYGISAFNLPNLTGEGMASELWTFHSILGALESIAIGLVIYFFIIRRDEIKHGYRNLWPEKLDLENLVYRPVLLVALPKFFGWISGVLDKPVDLIGRTIHKYVLKDLPREHAAHELTSEQRLKRENREIVLRSLSYGLLLACFGLFVLISYLLYLIFRM